MKPAGTLEIQLIADVARLQKDMRDMQRAVDGATGDMTNGFDRTGKSAKAANDNIGDLAREADKLRSKIDPMYDAQKRFNKEMDAADVLLKKGMISTREHAQAVTLARNALQDHAASVTGNSSALKVMNPHVADAGEKAKFSRHHIMNLGYQFQDMFVGLASGQKPMTVFLQQGTQIGSVMADAGVGIGGTIKQLGGLIAGFLRAHPILLAVSAAVGVVTAAVNMMAGDISKASGVTVTAGDVMLGTFDVIRSALTTKVTAAFEAMGLNVGTVWDNVVDFTRRAINIMIGSVLVLPDLIRKTIDLIPEAFGDAFYSAANAAIKGLNALVQMAAKPINAIIDGMNAAFGTDIPRVVMNGIASIENPYAGAMAKLGKAGVDSVVNSFSTDYIGKFSSVIQEAAVNRATQRAAEEAGDKVGKKVGESAGKAAADETMNKFLENVDKQFGTAMAELQKKFGGDNIYARIGIDVDADYKAVFDEINKRRDDQIKEEREAVEKNLKLAEDGARIIGDVIGGAAGEAVVKVFDVLKKDFPDLFAETGGIFGSIKKGLDDILAGFGTSFKELGAGAAMGKAMDGLLGSIGVKSSNTGAQIGGAIGNAAFGPIGAIAGSILGGVVGGLFKKTKKASATIAAMAGELDVASIVGNSAKFKETAGTLAGAVVDGLNKAASALGAEITNSLNVSIGQRKDKFVVDTMGLGRTKGSGTVSFASEAEAIAYAIDDAIRDGVLGGLRAGTEKLLKGFGDLEDRLQKAVDFEGVFKALKADADPLGQAIDMLDKRFAALIVTFQEAGATSAEWADLEKYYQLEREKAIKEGNAKALEAVNSARDQLTEAYNRESEAILTTLERFKNLTADLESFRISLAEQLMTAEELYKSAQDKFNEVAKLAEEGNAKAIEQLVQVSEKYLDAARNFLTPEEYNREIQNVMKAVDLAIVQTKTMEDYAQLQLDALNNSVDGLITLNESVLSVRDAIAGLNDALGKVGTASASMLVFAPTAAAASTDWATMTPEQQADALRAMGFSIPGFASGGTFGGGLRIVGESGPELEATGASRVYSAGQTAEMLGGGASVRQEIAELRSEMKLAMYQIAKNTGKTTEQLQRWDGDGMPEVRVVA